MDENASPRPWRVSDEGDQVFDANDKPVAATWQMMRGIGRANAALIVAAVNAYLSPPADGHGWCRLVAGPWTRIVPTCPLPAGHEPPCVEVPTTGPPHAHREGKFYTLDGPPTPGATPICALPLGHLGPCVSKVSAPLDSLGRRLCERAPGCLFIAGHDGLCRDTEPCSRDPVCDQRAGHEGPCRYEFPAGPPRLPAHLADPPRGCAPGCACALGHDGPCVPPARAMPSPTLGDPVAGMGEPLSSDCRLPLRHAPGCQCAVL